MKKLRLLYTITRKNFMFSSFPAISRATVSSEINLVDAKDFIPLSAAAIFGYVATEKLKVTWPIVSDFMGIDFDDLAKLLNQHNKFLNSACSKRYNVKIGLVINGLKLENEKIQG